MFVTLPTSFELYFIKKKICRLFCHRVDAQCIAHAYLRLGRESSPGVWDTLQAI